MVIGAVLVCELACLGGCLVTDNPDFEHGGDDESTSTDSGTGESGDCEPGDVDGLDCDDDGFCESDRRDIDTCGTCGRSCRLLGQEGACMEKANSFWCEGTFELPVSEDVYIDAMPADHNAEGESILVASDMPRTNAFIAGPALETLPEPVTFDGYAALCLTGLGGDQVLGHVILEEWSADTINWGNKPSIQMPPDLTIDPIVGRDCVEITALVEAWWSTTPNHGLALLASSMGSVEYLASESGAGPVYELNLRW